MNRSSNQERERRREGRKGEGGKKEGRKEKERMKGVGTKKGRH